MKITVCGSLVFSNEMKSLADMLTVAGHEVVLPYTTEQIIRGEVSLDEIKRTKENGKLFERAIKLDAIRRHQKEIANSDAILVLNPEKKGVKNYIGANTFLEMGFAHVLNKKIFIMNGMPEMGYHAEEIMAMQPVILNGDIGKIGNGPTPRIILATTSPFRREFFRNLGLDFIAEGSDVIEKFEGRPETPEELVRNLSRRKAESVAKNRAEGIVVGFDSVMEFGGRIFEKPGNRKEAFERLKMLSGKDHGFLTGIHMIDAGTGKSLSRVVSTSVSMRELTNQEINKYLDQDKNEIYRKTCLGYDSYGNLSSSFMKEISGDIYGYLQGVPMADIMEMLSEMGYKV